VARRKKGAEAPVKEAPEEGATESPAAPERPVISDEEMFQAGRAWYVVHTYSGYEDKARTNLEHRIKSMDSEDLIFYVVIPSVDEIEIRDGARRTVPRKLFPGYVLVQMIEMRQDDPAASEQDKALSSKAWTVVRNTPGVTGFVGSGATPTPLEKTEVLSILRQMRAEEPRIKVGKGKVRVLVSFFGRETPVELDFLQVERL
jgi:transcriptional antiterminator NusG